MLTLVPTPHKSIADYAAVVGADAVAELRAGAEPLRGARVLHVNSTAFGGGVAELLNTLVPLANDLGIETEWRVIHGHEQFFAVTKAVHNGLQGAPVPWTQEMRAIYRTVNEENAEAFADGYDIVVVHDPQPAGLLPQLIEDHGPPRGRWIWRCHIDSTSPHPPVWEFLRPLVGTYHGSIFTMPEFVPPGLDSQPTGIIPPSIDPLSVKNMPLDQPMVREVMRRYGIDTNRPLIVQVSRFDPWKDPIGVIDAYRIVKKEIPHTQLALIASMAHDDPEGWEVFARVNEHRDNDPDVFVLSNLEEVGALAVNAFQRAASVVVQKSLREGFGLVVAEAMWKGKPVIGGNVGGIRLQITDGQTGFLVSSIEECAARIIELLGSPRLATTMGRAAKRRVRSNFLSPTQLAAELNFFSSLAG